MICSSLYIILLNEFIKQTAGTCQEASFFEVFQHSLLVAGFFLLEGILDMGSQSCGFFSYEKVDCWRFRKTTPVKEGSLLS